MPGYEITLPNDLTTFTEFNAEYKAAVRENIFAIIRAINDGELTGGNLKALAALLGTQIGTDELRDYNFQPDSLTGDCLADETLVADNFASEFLQERHVDYASVLVSKQPIVGNVECSGRKAFTVASGTQQTTLNIVFEDDAETGQIPTFTDAPNIKVNSIETSSNPGKVWSIRGATPIAVTGFGLQIYLESNVGSDWTGYLHWSAKGVGFY